MNTIEKAKGKKFAYLHYDIAQKVIIERLEMTAVPSEMSDFGKKCNNNQVDAIAAPAYAFKPIRNRTCDFQKWGDVFVSSGEYYGRSYYSPRKIP